MCNCWTFIVIFLACMVLLLDISLPCSMIIYGVKYKTTITCDITNDASTASLLIQNIGISKWMIVHGAIGTIDSISITFLIIVGFGCTQTNKRIFFSLLVFSYLLALFRLSWLIIGAIMFWKDCAHVLPQSVNELMWINLTFGLVGIFSNFFKHKLKQQE